jgi:hypothetical protein
VVLEKKSAWLAWRAADAMGLTRCWWCQYHSGWCWEDGAPQHTGLSVQDSLRRVFSHFYCAKVDQALLDLDLKQESIFLKGIFQLI